VDEIMELIKGKIAIVTGSAQPDSMGAGIARLFSENGATVICCDINEKMVKETAAALMQDTGNVTEGLFVDITSQDSVKQVVSYTKEKYGRIDILVNNAGYNQRAAVLELTKDNFEKTFAINAWGTFNMLQNVAQVMKEQREGRIVNIASCSGRKPCRYELAYGSSKLAVMGMTQVAALELGEYNIRVNAVCPEATLCGMAKRDDLTSEEAIENYKKNSALHRMGTPLDQAKVALFLCSELADHVTGELIVVSGGYFFNL
jgi:NAD(P)-dependent dehydrogenase (short-subunit alcohol dehydrogenase family)